MKMSDDKIQTRESFVWETDDGNHYSTHPKEGYFALAFLEAAPKKGFPALRWAVFWPGGPNPSDCLGVELTKEDVFRKAEDSLRQKIAEFKSA